MTGIAVTVTVPAFHNKPPASVAEAFWLPTGAVANVAATMSTLFNVMACDETADCVPVVVIAFALSVQAPFLNATAPVVGLNAAVLKLIVTGDDDASAIGAT